MVLPFLLSDTGCQQPFRYFESSTTGKTPLSSPMAIGEVELWRTLEILLFN
jgi:hypothetical protein